jgi:hypothetical protein
MFPDRQRVSSILADNSFRKGLEVGGKVIAVLSPSRIPPLLMHKDVFTELFTMLHSKDFLLRQEVLNRSFS